MSDGDRPVSYWQVAAGSEGRDYAADFLRYGLAFVNGQTQIATITQVKPGDRMLLKRGLSQVVAAGVAVERNGACVGNGDKAWLYDFDGWELPAYCHVQWHKADTPQETSGLTRATIQQVRQAHLKDLAEVALRTWPQVASAATEPAQTHDVKDEAILETLIQEGLRPGAAEDLTAALRRIRLLAQYHSKFNWNEVNEAEVRSFLVAPLMLALGWPEQNIKMELATSAGRIDVACFARPYRKDRKGQINAADCVLIVECKDFKSGLDYAHSQGKEYPRVFPSARAVVATNGYCYKVYPRVENDFTDHPAAYLNLLWPQDRYPRDPERVAGALEAVKLLLPQSWR